MVTWSQAAAEIDVTFDFCDYLCSQKNGKIERCKKPPKMFFARGGEDRGRTETPTAGDWTYINSCFV